MDAATLVIAKKASEKRLNWRGDWAATTAYAKNDLVTFNGGLYRASAAFTSGASFVLANWLELVQQSGTYASLTTSASASAGRDIDGGQILAARREPILTVHARYPNPRTNKRILWGNGDTVYAMDRSHKLFKSTDGGINWTSKAIMGSVIFADRDCFLVCQAPANANKIVAIAVNSSVKGAQAYYSTNDGSAFTAGTSFQSEAKPLGPSSLCEDLNTGYIYFGEYETTDTMQFVNVWRSTDGGATFTVFYQFPSLPNASPHIRHIHGCFYDSVSQRVYFCVGDRNDLAGIYRVTADGTTVEAVLINTQMPVPTDYEATATGLMFFPDYIAWFSDAPGYGHLWRMARTQIGQATPVVQQVYRVNSEGFAPILARSDGSAYIVCSSNATYTGTRTGPTPDHLDTAVHVYAVTDQGATIYEIGTMGGVVNSTPRLHGLGLITTDNRFWVGTFAMRTAMTALVSLDRGAGQQILEATTDLPALTTSKERASSGQVSLTASQSVTFGHTRCPATLTRLHIFNAGVYKQSGSGTPKVKITKTDGTVIGGIDTSNLDMLVATNIEGADFLASADMTANDIIEFRVYESGGASSCVTDAFVVFGWGATFNGAADNYGTP